MAEPRPRTTRSNALGDARSGAWAGWGAGSATVVGSMSVEPSRVMRMPEEVGRARRRLRAARLRHVQVEGDVAVRGVRRNVAAGLVIVKPHDPATGDVEDHVLDGVLPARPFG